eukprot:COSAG06_NODE_6487_length_2912_cov_3.283683_6_plen_22_part_01
MEDQVRKRISFALLIAKNAAFC